MSDASDWSSAVRDTAGIAKSTKAATGSRAAARLRSRDGQPRGSARNPATSAARTGFAPRAQSQVAATGSRSLADDRHAPCASALGVASARAEKAHPLGSRGLGGACPARGPARQTSDEVVPVALGGLLVETRELLDPAADLWTAGVVVEEIQ